MRRVFSIVAALGGALGLLVQGLACSDDETVLGDLPPTEIAVDPLEFLGALPCSNDPGAAKSFVAVLTDTTEGSFTLAAGPPAPCSSRMAFRYVLTGHVYTADVDVYDVPAEQLFPAGGPHSGSRVMHDASGHVVAPRWRTQCGVGEGGGAVSVVDTSVVVAGCTPLQSEGTAVTSVQVDPSDALPGKPGEIACTSEPGGAIDEIDIIPTDPGGEPGLPRLTVACGSAPVLYDEGIAAGQTYSFRLEARAEGEEEATWASTCSTVAAEGIQRTAECSTFTSAGTIVVPADSLGQSSGYRCGLDFNAYDLSLVPDPTGAPEITVPRSSCATTTRIAPVAAGHYVGTLNTYRAGIPSHTARCEVDVLPATETRLACTFD